MPAAALSIALMVLNVGRATPRTSDSTTRSRTSSPRWRRPNRRRWPGC